MGIGIILLLWYSLCLPRDLFPQGYATIVESSDGKLLGGKIAPDGQWRFPELDSVPHKLKEAILAYEDAYFYYHPGVNPYLHRQSPAYKPTPWAYAAWRQYPYPTGDSLGS